MRRVGRAPANTKKEEPPPSRPDLRKRRSERFDTLRIHSRGDATRFLEVLARKALAHFVNWRRRR